MTTIKSRHIVFDTNSFAFLIVEFNKWKLHLRWLWPSLGSLFMRLGHHGCSTDIKMRNCIVLSLIDVVLVISLAEDIINNWNFKIISFLEMPIPLYIRTMIVSFEILRYLPAQVLGHGRLSHSLCNIIHFLCLFKLSRPGFLILIHFVNCVITTTIWGRFVPHWMLVLQQRLNVEATGMSNSLIHFLDLLQLHLHVWTSNPSICVAGDPGPLSRFDVFAIVVVFEYWIFLLIIFTLGGRHV